MWGGPLWMPLFFFVIAERLKSVSVHYLVGGGGRGVTFDGPNIAVYLIVRFEFQKYSTLSVNQGTTYNRNE